MRAFKGCDRGRGQTLVRACVSARAVAARALARGHRAVGAPFPDEGRGRSGRAGQFCGLVGERLVQGLCLNHAGL